MSDKRRIYGREDISASDSKVETYGPKGIPHPREATSQVTQYEHGHPLGGRKDRKIKMNRKLT